MANIHILNLITKLLNDDIPFSYKHYDILDEDNDVNWCISFKYYNTLYAFNNHNFNKKNFNNFMSKIYNERFRSKKWVWDIDKDLDKDIENDNMKIIDRKLPKSPQNRFINEMTDSYNLLAIVLSIMLFFVLFGFGYFCGYLFNI